jgi:hypothetical protein
MEVLRNIGGLRNAGDGVALVTRSAALVTIGV